MNNSMRSERRTDGRSKWTGKEEDPIREEENNVGPVSVWLAFTFDYKSYTLWMIPDLE